MTNIRLGSAAVGLALAAGLAACSNDLTSLNDNPNNPVGAPAGAVFTNAVDTTVARFLGTTYDLRGTEFVAQHLAEVQYPDEDRYARLQGPNTTTIFDQAYSRELEDLQKVVGVGIAGNHPSVYAPALVMRTWTFSYLTDSWGDIPYSQALKGDSSDAGLSPAYDGQQAIYADFFATLDKAVADLANDPEPDSTVGSADPIYGGDMAEWEKFANSLHARLALRIVNKDETLASAELAKALADPAKVILDNADNAKLAWPGNGAFNNPWADNFDSRDDHRMSRTLMDILKADNDPRVRIYAQKADTNTLYADGYGGMPNGLLNDSAGTYLNVASPPSALFYASNGGASFPSFLFTAAEGNFIMAEVAQRGLVSSIPAGDAAGYYEAGIRASMEQWGVPTSQIDAYLAQPAVQYKGGVDGLKQIATQKWIALYTDGGNAWAEWRRTCQPATLVAGKDAIVNFIPRRFEYSQTEYSVNAENLNAAIGSMGGDSFAERMWWDSNPTVAPTYESANACNGAPAP